MDRFAEKQERIIQLRAETSDCYPELWLKIINAWNATGAEDRVWLMYSANYLFRTNNIRWAIDPLTLNWRVKNAPKVNVTQDLSGLSFALLTHGHKDHFDLDLLSALRHLPIIWVVPEFILPKVMEQAGLRRANIIVPAPLYPIEFGRIRILPFHGLHWETALGGSLKRIPAMGYQVEFNGRRWLFPGDTRTYDASQLPALDSLDGVFAHLWLGRSSALMDDPPLLDAFCRFFLDLKPHQLILTHLNEFGRDAKDFWDESHFQVVRSKFRQLSKNIQISSASMGESILL